MSVLAKVTTHAVLVMETWEELFQSLDLRDYLPRNEVKVSLKELNANTPFRAYAEIDEEHNCLFSTTIIIIPSNLTDERFQKIIAPMLEKNLIEPSWRNLYAFCLLHEFRHFMQYDEKIKNKGATQFLVESAEFHAQVKTARESMDKEDFNQYYRTIPSEADADNWAIDKLKEYLNK